MQTTLFACSHVNSGFQPEQVSTKSVRGGILVERFWLVRVKSALLSRKQVYKLILAQVN